LNNLVYWLAQIAGSIVIGVVLDAKAFSRRVRAFTSWAVLFIMVFIVHIWAYFYQRCAEFQSFGIDDVFKVHKGNIPENPFLPTL